MFQNKLLIILLAIENLEKRNSLIKFLKNNNIHLNFIMFHYTILQWVEK